MDLNNQNIRHNHIKAINAHHTLPKDKTTGDGQLIGYQKMMGKCQGS